MSAQRMNSREDILTSNSGLQNGEKLRIKMEID
jgi:hypothetical protein